MTPTKEKALEKMLEEMSNSHSATEDIVHNFLCTQDDEKLNQGILKKDRTIKRAIQYCASKAIKFAESNAAMVPDEEVFSWIKEYYLADKAEVPNVQAEVKATTVAEKTSVKKVKEAPKKEAKKNLRKELADGQMSLLDFL